MIFSRQFFLLLGNDTDIARYSHHPVHQIVDDHEMPSAFIPVCSYATVLAEEGNQFKFPACTAFKPVILDGEQCFQMNINRSLMVTSGKNGGILILFEYNSGRNIVYKKETAHQHSLTGPGVRIIDLSRVKMKQEIIGNDKWAKAYIQTLQRFESYSAGGYVIKNVKKMTTKRNFFSLNENIRKCQDEQYEVCKMNAFIAAVNEKCRCVPLSLAEVFSSVQVFLIKHKAIFYHFSMSGPPLVHRR